MLQATFAPVLHGLLCVWSQQSLVAFVIIMTAWVMHVLSSSLSAAHVNLVAVFLLFLRDNESAWQKFTWWRCHGKQKG